MSGATHPQPDPDELVLEFPNDAAQLSTARMFASALGRHFGAHEETAEDLKLGISESVASAVRDGYRSEPVRIAARVEGPGRLGVHITWRRRLPGQDRQATLDVPTEELVQIDDAEGQLTMGLDLILGLFDGAQVGEEPGGRRTVTFSLALTEQPAD